MGKTTVRPPKTPELSRETACREDAQVIGAFLEWLTGEWVREVAAHRGISESDITIFDIRDDRLPDILHSYFKLNPDKLERERREILLYCRLCNEEKEQRKGLRI